MPMRKHVIELCDDGAFVLGAPGESGVVYPKGQVVDVHADRQARREARHKDRRWRHERHGQKPGLEIHTV